MASNPPEIYKRAKSTKKSSPVKRVTVSAETRAAYEAKIKEHEKRDESGRFLPEEMKGKR